ncbi:MAG: SPOR domain-containing protein [Cytophagales bacterium]|nr:SPOR domain-containing protein [Cytophagales bacterium]
MIDSCIKNLLFYHDCVVIPGLGAFVCNYEGSAISISKNKIYPPYKKIAFNDKITTDDGLLTAQIADIQQVNINQAKNILAQYVADLKVKLFDHKEYIFDQIGKIYYNNENLLIFEQNVKFNYLSESFGLPELYIKPINRQESEKVIFNPKKSKSMASKLSDNYEEDENQEQEAAEHTSSRYDEDEYEPKKSNNLMLYYVLAIFSFLATAGTAYYINMDKETYAIGSFSPLSWFQKDSSTETDNKLLPENAEATTDASPEASSEAPVAEESPAPTPAPAPKSKSTVEPIDLSDAITASTGRFYVIAGSFTRPRKAVNLRNKIKADGLTSNIIAPSGERVYKVSLADFATYEEAKAKKTELKQIYGDDIWVFTY